MSGVRRLAIGPITQGKTRGNALADEIAVALDAPKAKKST